MNSVQKLSASAWLILDGVEPVVLVDSQSEARKIVRMLEKE